MLCVGEIMQLVFLFVDMEMCTADLDGDGIDRHGRCASASHPAHDDYPATQVQDDQHAWNMVHLCIMIKTTPLDHNDDYIAAYLVKPLKKNGAR